MPATALKLLGLGQTTAFSAALNAPTQKFMGLTEASIKVNGKTETPAVLGNLGPGPMSALLQHSAEGSIEATATYEMLRYVMNGLFTATTAATSSCSIYAYSYSSPVGSTQAHKVYSIEYGTSGTAYKVQSAVFSKATISGESGGLWKAAVDWIGKQCSTSTGPASLSDTDANPIRMANTTLYVDASTGTVGGTSVSATLISFEWSYETGRHLKQFAGSITPGDYGEGKHNTSLKVVAEFNASAKAYVDELVASTPTIVQKQIRIEADQGSSASQKTARLDFAGTLVDGYTLFGDREGNVTVELNFSGYYSTAMTNVTAAHIRCASSQTP